MARVCGDRRVRGSPTPSHSPLHGTPFFREAPLEGPIPTARPGLSQPYRFVVNTAHRDRKALFAVCTYFLNGFTEV